MYGLDNAALRVLCNVLLTVYSAPPVSLDPLLPLPVHVVPSALVLI